MTNPFDKHLDGCTPPNKCANCQGLEFLYDHLDDVETVDEFLGMLAACDVGDVIDIFNTHKEGCSPVKPCSNCETLSFLKNNLGSPDGRFDNNGVKYFVQIFVPDVKITSKTKEVGENKTARLLLRKVTELDISTRSAHALRNDNIIYIGDLVEKTGASMLRIPDFGRKSLSEIKKVLSQMGLRLGMEIPGWPPENIEKITLELEQELLG